MFSSRFRYVVRIEPTRRAFRAFAAAVVLAMMSASLPADTPRHAHGSGAPAYKMEAASVSLAASSPSTGPALASVGTTAGGSLAGDMFSAQVGSVAVVVAGASSPPAACAGAMDCADLDGDGIRDDGCVYWQCLSGACVAANIVFADLGGANGACEPDMAADGNDRFHALNCFSNLTTLGDTGYPCEANPPSAANVDAAGLNAPCDPDGVCDGHDAFAALNAFSGTTTCDCSGGPAPASMPAPNQETAVLSLAPSVEVAAPGDVVTVDVFLDGAVQDLRGYQLHLAATAGDAGALRLVDIALRTDKRSAFIEHGPWSAFNLRTAQVLSGLDGPGVMAPSGTQLATFTYRVEAFASGTVVLDALYDERDLAHRTVLFATPEGSRIVVEGSDPAVIAIAPSGTRVRG